MCLQICRYKDLPDEISRVLAFGSSRCRYSDASGDVSVRNLGSLMNLISYRHDDVPPCAILALLAPPITPISMWRVKPRNVFRDAGTRLWVPRLPDDSGQGHQFHSKMIAYIYFNFKCLKISIRR